MEIKKTSSLGCFFVIDVSLFYSLREKLRGKMIGLVSSIVWIFGGVVKFDVESDDIGGVIVCEL